MTDYLKLADELDKLCESEAFDGATAIRELVAEVERLRVDAERYAWLRSKGRGDHLALVICTAETTPEQMDAAIDSARKA